MRVLHRIYFSDAYVIESERIDIGASCYPDETEVEIEDIIDTNQLFEET